MRVCVCEFVRDIKKESQIEVGVAIVTDCNNTTIIDKEGKVVNTYCYSLKENKGCFKVNS